MFLASDRSGYAARRELRSFRRSEKKWRPHRVTSPVERRALLWELAPPARIGLYFIFSKNTISAATSAGDTPEILLACPKFSGRMRFNFCRASNRRPITVS